MRLAKDIVEILAEPETKTPRAASHGVNDQSRRYSSRFEPSKAALRRQHFLKSPPAAAGAGIVPSELLDELFMSLIRHDAPITTTDARLGRETPTAFADVLETGPDLRTTLHAA
jgi:hypothetical protein